MSLDASTKDVSAEMSWEDLCKWSVNVSEEMVNLAMDNQSAWTHFYMDSLKASKDTPAMMVELVDEMSQLLDSWSEAQREIWDNWFSAVKELESGADEQSTAPVAKESKPAPKKKRTTTAKKRTATAKKRTKAAEKPKAPVAEEAPVEEAPVVLAETAAPEAEVVETIAQAEPAPQPESAAPADEQAAPAEESVAPAEQQEEYAEEKKAE